jgi:ankyrin repeat protein
MSPSARRTDGTTLCVRVSSGTVLEALLASGANVNHVDATGESALLCGDIVKAEILLAHGAHIDHARVNGTTALLVACSGRHVDMVECLLNAGADTRLVDSNGDSALLQAAHSQMLRGHAIDVNHVSNNGLSALIQAAQRTSS